MRLKVTVNDVVYDVDVEVEEKPPPALGAILVAGGGISAPHPAAPTHSRVSGEGGVVAPVSGTVSRVLVEEGQAIEAGDVVVVLEAMKMETEITAPSGGTVGAILVATGDAVSGGQVLVEIS